MPDDTEKPAQAAENPEEKPKEPEPPTWEYRTDFGINKKMQEVIVLTISATQSEIQTLRRKLEKLQYGS